jgi:hypothetical protein
MDAVVVSLLQVSPVTLWCENLNQTVTNPSDLHDWRTRNAGDDLASGAAATEANFCVEAVEGSAINADKTEDSRAGW